METVADQILCEEASATPSDTVKPEDLVLQLPEWFDREKHNQARRFFWDNRYGLVKSMVWGLVYVISVPTILNILIHTRRSSKASTAYKRYAATMLHVLTWFQDELKPGAESWKSLHSIRFRHTRASMAAKVTGIGHVSQRDLSLTLYGFLALALMQPMEFGVKQLMPGDWDAYVHFWRVLGHMLGLQDKYNLCQKTAEDTRILCQIITDRVYTPHMVYVPEYYLHMSHVYYSGLLSLDPMSDKHTIAFFCKRLAKVPGYVYNEDERMNLQKRLIEKLKGKPEDTGVDIRSLLPEPFFQDVPTPPPQFLYIKDFDCLDNIPAYIQLSRLSKFKFTLNRLITYLICTFDICRIFMNCFFSFLVFFTSNFPILAFYRFGFKESFVSIFRDHKPEDSRLRKNCEFYS